MELNAAIKEEPKALRAGIHSALFDLLTTGHWPPGAHLSIDGLAREFAVSPTPVREAMVALEKTGLIKYRAKRGYVVAPPLKPKQIRELIDARLVLERAALSRALRKSWSELSHALRKAYEAHCRATNFIRRSDTMDYKYVREYFEADIAFHHAFFKFADNEFLSNMNETLGAHAHRMRQTWASGREQFDFDETLHEHSQILTGIEERNHDGALAALELHLSNVCVRFGG